MSKSELIAGHDRLMIWEAAAGPIKVCDMTIDHLKAVTQQLRWLIRRNKSYPVFHPKRRHEVHREYQLTVMIAELEWRTHNDLQDQI